MIMWGAMVFGLLAFAAIVAVLSRAPGSRSSMAAADARLIVLATGTLALVLAVTAVVVPRLLRLPPAGDAEATARQRLLIGWAIAESGSLAALTGALATSDLRLLGAALVPFLVLLSQVPSEARWQELVGEPDSVTGGP